MSTEPESEVPGARSRVPVVLGLLLTVAAMAVVGYFAFYDTGRGGWRAPTPKPVVVQGGASVPSAPAPAR